MRPLTAALSFCCLALGFALAANPAHAGEETVITGFDQWALGTPLPMEGDKFYEIFSGPMTEDLTNLSLEEYDTLYSLEMPSGTYMANVTCGYGPENLLDAIVVSFDVEGQTLTTEQAGALVADILQVWGDTFSDDLLLLDSLPGGGDRAADADANAGVMILSDSAQSSAWLNWNNDEVLVMYTTQAVGEELFDSFNATGAEDDPAADDSLAVGSPG